MSMVVEKEGLSLVPELPGRTGAFFDVIYAQIN